MSRNLKLDHEHGSSLGLQRYQPDRSSRRAVEGRGRRIDVANAVNDQVVAYSADTVGAVSVSYGFVEVTSDTSLLRNIKIDNKSNQVVTYTASYSNTFAPAGTSISFPNGTTIRVPANGTANLPVQLK